MAKVVQYIFNEEGKQTGWQFVDAPEEAPLDDKNYVRKAGQWVESVAGQPSGGINIDGGTASSVFTNLTTIDGNT